MHIFNVEQFSVLTQIRATTKNGRRRHFDHRIVSWGGASPPLNREYLVQTSGWQVMKAVRDRPK